MQHKYLYRNIVPPQHNELYIVSTIECCDISCREETLKSSSEMEKESLKKKLETTNLLFEQKEKDFQSQKAEVLFLK
jgi:hypothetical protein